jgi:hypothetical protein
VVAHYNDVPKSLRNFDPTTLPPAVRSSFHGDQATIQAILETLDFRLRDRCSSPKRNSELVAFLIADRSRGS